MMVIGEILVGIQKPLPPRGFPKGKLRWRMRTEEVVVGRVKTETGIREFHVKENGGYWEPAGELGRNETAI